MKLAGRLRVSQTFRLMAIDVIASCMNEIHVSIYAQIT